MSENPGDLYATHFAAESMEQEVSSVLIAYRLTLSGAQTVESTPWHRDSSMAPYSVRVRTGDVEITLSVSDWGSRADEVRPFLREWIRGRVHLGGTKLKSSSRRRDPRTGSMPGAERIPGCDAHGTICRKNPATTGVVRPAGPWWEADGARPSRTMNRVSTVRRDPMPRGAHPAPDPLYSGKWTGLRSRGTRTSHRHSTGRPARAK